MKVALTGASGNMGREVLIQIMELEDVEKVKILVLRTAKDNKFVRKVKKMFGNRLEVIRGSIADARNCAKLVTDVDYVIHMAAVIPPKSDWNEVASYMCNQVGTKMLTKVIKAMKKQPKFVHISTVALYGNRNEKHPWGRVGDPLMPSVYDSYAKHKLKGERYVLDADLDCWAVLRQSAMLHPNMLNDNISDGLMFHTPLNAPLEWVSSRDSGYLIKRLLERDSKGEIDGFWKQIYNIGAGAANRKTGYDTFKDGFGIIGGSAEKFLKPHWHGVRNFHGLWFADSDELNSYFGYQRDTTEKYWKDIADAHKIYAVAKIIPPVLISTFLFRPLLSNGNSPRHWAKTGQEGKVRAFFGGRENFNNLPEKWEDCGVWAKGNTDYNYDELRDLEKFKAEGRLLKHGYDDTKPISEWTIEDCKSAAEFRGGKCLSTEMSSPYEKLAWECHDGHRFFSSAYTILKGGHWCPECCQPEPWDYDRLSKFMPFYAQVWYDSHAKEENLKYYFTKDGDAEFSVVSEGERK